MAEYIKFRMGAAKVGVTMAFLALLAGISDKARAATPRAHADAAASIPGLSFVKLDKLYMKLDNVLLKLESKLENSYLTAHKADDEFLKIKTASAQFLKIDDANLKYLTITDAALKYLPAGGTAADSNKLGGMPASSFVQGNNTSVASGALSSLTQTSQKLLSVGDGGIIAVSIANMPGAGRQITIHNGSSTPLAGAVDMGDGSVSQALNLKPNGDTSLPIVPTQQQAAEIRLQIFPGGSFTNVVSILIGLTPNPTNVDQTEAVAQAFSGGV
jgi:hypothetical protein